MEAESTKLKMYQGIPIGTIKGIMSKGNTKDSNVSTGGFSLVEMLVVVLVFSILAVVVTKSLTTSLRTSTKSESIGHVRENVEYAMSVIERSLRSAKGIDCGGSSATKLQYLTSSGTFAYFECSGVNIYYFYNPPLFYNLINTNEVRITSCQFMAYCSALPHAVDILIRAQERKAQGAESAVYTARTKILLRNY